MKKRVKEECMWAINAMEVVGSSNHAMSIKNKKVKLMRDRPMIHTGSSEVAILEGLFSNGTSETVST